MYTHTHTCRLVCWVVKNAVKFAQDILADFTDVNLWLGHVLGKARATAIQDAVANGSVTAVVFEYHI